MKRLYNICVICVVLVVFIGIGLFGYYHQKETRVANEIAAAAIDTNYYRPYVLGTTISFANGGNSAEFVKASDGWGGQEPEHRCALGKQAILRLYIPDSVGENLRLTVDGFGVYSPKKYESQEVKVYANDRQITTWAAAYDGPFSVDIPTDLIKNNTLVLRFEFAHPYSPPRDSRKIGMAVRSIEISRVVGVQTKRKIGKWVKENLMGGGVKQEYDTTVSKGDNWL